VGITAECGAALAGLPSLTEMRAFPYWVHTDFLSQLVNLRHLEFDFIQSTVHFRHRTPLDCIELVRSVMHKEEQLEG
jgi:hypothetical protein